MRRFIGFNRLLLTGIVAAAAVLSVTQVAQAGPPAPVVPGKIEVAEGNKVFLVGHGIGVRSCAGPVALGPVALGAVTVNERGLMG